MHNVYDRTCTPSVIIHVKKLRSDSCIFEKIPETLIGQTFLVGSASYSAAFFSMWESKEQPSQLVHCQTQKSQPLLKPVYLVEQYHHHTPSFSSGSNERAGTAHGSAAPAAPAAPAAAAAPAPAAATAAGTAAAAAAVAMAAADSTLTGVTKMEKSAGCWGRDEDSDPLVVVASYNRYVPFPFSLLHFRGQCLPLVLAVCWCTYSVVHGAVCCSTRTTSTLL